MAGGGLGVAGLGGRTFGTGETAGQDDVGDSNDVLSGLHPLTSAAAAARPHCQAVRAGPAPRPAAGGAAAAEATRRDGTGVVAGKGGGSTVGLGWGGVKP